MTNGSPLRSPSLDRDADGSAAPGEVAATGVDSGAIAPSDAGMRIVFVSLAMNQARFFAALGEVLAGRGFGVAHVTFHEPSMPVLSATGRPAFNAFERSDRQSETPDPRQFGIDNVSLLISHEKAFYDTADSAGLERKLGRYLAAMDSILAELQAASGGRVVLVQELGGFCSVLAGFHAARSRGIDNVFIEPSFFRGRVAFVRNSLRAAAVADPVDGEVQTEVSDYLERTLAEQSLVIPDKDSRHYRAVSHKIADSHNLRRLAEKLIDKYVRRQREEFSHIGRHVTRHAEMFANSVRLRRFYQPLPVDEPFVYYPLHVPADVALTLRAPEYVDQYALLDYVARNLPTGHRLAVKEHPAMAGAVDYRRMRELLRRHDRLFVLDPFVKNYTIMSAASVVLTVNSKSGAEALLLGKPVVVLGDAFYRPTRLVRAVDRLADLPAALAAAVTSQTAADRNAIERYFQAVWDRSQPGELYQMDKESIAVFAASLEECLSPPA